MRVVGFGLELSGVDELGREVDRLFFLWITQLCTLDG